MMKLVDDDIIEIIQLELRQMKRAAKRLYGGENKIGVYLAVITRKPANFGTRSDSAENLYSLI